MEKNITNKNKIMAATQHCKSPLGFQNYFRASHLSLLHRNRITYVKTKEFSFSVAYHPQI